MAEQKTAAPQVRTERDATTNSLKTASSIGKTSSITNSGGREAENRRGFASSLTSLFTRASSQPARKEVAYQFASATPTPENSNTSPSDATSTSTVYNFLVGRVAAPSLPSLQHTVVQPVGSFLGRIGASISAKLSAAKTQFEQDLAGFSGPAEGRREKEYVQQPPWRLYSDNLREQERLLRRQILMLSTSEWNFLHPPDFPDEDTAQQLQLSAQDISALMPMAQACLESDKNLQVMRYYLVPTKVSEETFWRNYFLRVFLIKQTLLMHLATQPSASPSPSVAPEPTPSQPAPANNTPPTLSHDEELLQLEKELQAELENFEGSGDAPPEELALTDEGLEAEISQVLGTKEPKDGSVHCATAPQQQSDASQM